MVLNCIGVLFLTPGSVALVDRVSSSPRPFWEFLTGCRPKSVGLLNKSCHQYKDTPFLVTPSLHYFFHIPSPPFCECKWSLHATPSSPQGATHPHRVMTCALDEVQVRVCGCFVPRTTALTMVPCTAAFIG